MIWSGVLLMVTGAVLALAARGDVSGLDVRTAGLLVMGLGGVLLIAGILRLNRGRRRSLAAGTHRTGRRPAVPDRVYRTGKGKIAAMIIAVIYILSPVDLIPDVFLPAGVVDDATAFTWLVFAVGQEISRRRRQAV